MRNNGDGLKDEHSTRRTSDRGRQRCVTYMWDLNNDTNESVHKTETDSQTQKKNLWSLKGEKEEE